MPSFRLYLGHAAAAQFSPDAKAYPLGQQVGVELGEPTVTTVWNSNPDAWDSLPADNPNIIFSDGDKTATADDYNREVGSTTVHSTGKYFAEVTVSGDDVDSGFYDDTANWALVQKSGTVNTSFGDFPGIFPPLSDGDVIGMAIDIDRGLVWFRVNGGDWNNDPTQGPD